MTTLDAPPKPPEQDVKQAMHSLMETLTAMLGYQRRAETTADDVLRDILLDHVNRGKEHLVILLEWLRQRDSVLDEHMRAYLFQRGAEPAPTPAPPPVVTMPAPAPETVVPKEVSSPREKPVLSVPIQKIRG